MLRHGGNSLVHFSRGGFELGIKYYPTQIRLAKFYTIRALDMFLWKTAYAFVHPATLKNRVPYYFTEHQNSTICLWFPQKTTCHMPRVSISMMFLLVMILAILAFWTTSIFKNRLNNAPHLKTHSREKQLRALGFALGFETQFYHLDKFLHDPILLFLHLQNES